MEYKVNVSNLTSRNLALRNSRERCIQIFMQEAIHYNYLS